MSVSPVFFFLFFAATSSLLARAVSIEDLSVTKFQQMSKVQSLALHIQQNSRYEIGDKRLSKQKHEINHKR